MKRKAMLLLFLLSASWPLIYPFLKPGYFPTHDGEWAVVRLAEMHRELRSLQIPPRWAGFLNHGYGYPLFQFTYPGPYLIAEILNLIGFGLTASIKILFVSTVFLSGLFMFLIGKKLWGTAGGLISAILYIYAPYRITNLFVRGSIGESVVFVLMPLLFWLFLLQSEKPKVELMIINSLILSLLFISHNVLSLLFLPVLFIWCVKTYLNNRYKGVLKSLLLSWVLGIALSAWFWLPVLLEKQFIRLSLITLDNKQANFVTFRELLSLAWSYGIRPPLRIGMIHFFIGLISFVILIYNHRKSKPKDYIKIIAVMLIFSFSLLFSNSKYFWELPLFAYVDFPWRILGIISFLLSLLGGMIGRGKYKVQIATGAVVLIMIFNFPYIQTQPRIYKSDDYYATNDATTTSANELMPIWVKQDPVQRADTKIQLTNFNQAELVEELDYRITLVTSASNLTPTMIKVNTVYFPGWQGYLDGKKIPINITNRGLIGLGPIPPGQHRIELKYERTPVRLIADFCTLISVSILLFIMYRYILVKNAVIK